MPEHRTRALLAFAAFLSAACSSSSSSAPDAAAADAAPDVSDAGSGSVDDAPADDAPVDTGGGDGRARAGYGEPCTVGDDTTCSDGFFCLVGPSGGSVGFCTKTCPSTSSAVCPGTPPGTAAYCVVTDVDTKGDKGCAFLCRAGSHTFTCPGALKCETTEDPPGSGQYLCLP